MKKLIITLSVCIALAPPPSQAQNPTLPPDFYGEALRRGYAAWQNTGWVRTTNGDPAPEVEYVTDGATPRAFIKKYGAMSLVLSSADTIPGTLDTLRRLDIAFNGPGALFPNPIAQEQEGYHRNFHLPWCGPGGKTLVPGFRWLKYPDIYPSIDMYIYCGSRGQKLMFVIRPQGNPLDLRMTFTGHDQMDVDVLGNLRMLLQDKWVVLPEAVAYQYDANNNILPVNWTAAYDADEVTGKVGFTFDQYDRYKPLVLLIGPPPMSGGPSVFTPGICWSTYYGGGGEDFIFDSRMDGLGNYCIVGQTFSTLTTFPIEAGAILTDVTPAVFAAKFLDNDDLVWSTIYGCSSGFPIGLTCARPPIGGELFFGGEAPGIDLPVPLNQPAGRYVDTDNAFGTRGFLASLNLDIGSLFWSTYFGGAGSRVTNLDFDALSNLYVCGSSSGDLPMPTELTPPAGSAAWTYSGNVDAFVSKLNQNFKVWWSTYIGGSGYDQAFSVRVGAGKVVVAGRTQSPSFQTLPAGGTGAHNFSSSSYSSDIFIEEFDLNGVQQWGTYFSYGGTLGSQGLAVDKNNGDVFLCGKFLAAQNNMPVSTTAPWYQNAVPGPLEKGFIWQVGADHRRKYSTFVTGTQGSNWLNAIIVNNDGLIAASGISWATSMSTACSGGLYCTTYPEGFGDAYLLLLTAAHARTWLTYFGGDLDVGDHAEFIRTIAFKGGDRLYAAGYTSSPYDPDLGQFFPLHDELGGAWWDSVLEDVSITNCDGFLTAFCIDAVPVGVSEATDHGHSTFTANYASGGGIQFIGIPQGSQPVLITDAGGRVVFAENVRIPSDGRGTLRTGELSSGIYLVRVGAAVGKLLIQQP